MPETDHTRFAVEFVAKADDQFGTAGRGKDEGLDTNQDSGRVSVRPGSALFLVNRPKTEV